MIRETLVRIIGVLYLALAASNLWGLTVPGVEEYLVSLPATFTRYLLMLCYAIGFILLRKWAAYLFLAAVTINWITFFTVYQGPTPVLPIWVSLAVPAAVAALLLLSWKSLR